MLGVVVVHQLLTLYADPRAFGNGACDEGVAADDDVFSYDGIAAEDGSARIDRHVVVNGRVALFATQVLTAPCRKRTFVTYNLLDLDMQTNMELCKLVAQLFFEDIICSVFCTMTCADILQISLLKFICCILYYYF